ncbi:MAG: hypothetical protein M0Z66_15935 [Thermaerobacter sp.]|nr:hypothetical protein [Thermaerobacter sp.]
MSVRARADGRWAYNGLQAVVLENAQLRAVVLPEAGAKLYALEDRAAAREWLWHNPRIAPERSQIGATFDNHWSGGADAFFPTCYPCSVDGVAIPDSGEWWSVPWQPDVHEDATGVTLEMTAGGRVYPVISRRSYRLSHAGRELQLGFHIQNVGHAQLPFLLGFHPALALRPGGRIVLPDGVAQVDETSDGTMGAVGQRYAWPLLETASGPSDMSCVRGPEVGQFAGHYLFPSGGKIHWSVWDPDGGPGLSLTASPEFTGVWLWQVYGGWRGYHHVALEPWSGYPITLSDAVAQGSARVLAPGEEFTASLTLSLLPPGAEHS